MRKPSLREGGSHSRQVTKPGLTPVELTPSSTRAVHTSLLTSPERCSGVAPANPITMASRERRVPSPSPSPILLALHHPLLCLCRSPCSSAIMPGDQLCAGHCARHWGGQGGAGWPLRSHRTPGRQLYTTSSNAGRSELRALSREGRSLRGATLRGRPPSLTPISGSGGLHSGPWPGREPSSGNTSRMAWPGPSPRSPPPLPPTLSRE